DLTADLVAGGRETALILLSDHGFAPVKEEFHLNRWLAAKGYQSKVGPEALALALDPTRIYFNQAGRFPGGRLSAAQSGELMSKVAAELKSEPAVQKVLFGRNLYSGRQAGSAPDMIVQPCPGYEFKAKFTPGPIYTLSPLQGTHTYENTFYFIKFWGMARPDPKIADILDLGRSL
ncbi:MAG: alkaline phosphatase family protein, partial [Deltaproteobacteria bacterium]|nr:alkaline phosphatase family protein [Deltaproteobacteria bacterium]